MNHVLASSSSSVQGTASSSNGQKTSLSEFSRLPILVRLLVFLVVFLENWVRVGLFLCRA